MPLEPVKRASDYLNDKVFTSCANFTLTNVPKVSVYMKYIRLMVLNSI